MAIATRRRARSAVPPGEGRGEALRRPAVVRSSPSPKRRSEVLARGALVHASEGGAAAAAGTRAPAVTSLAALLTRHILRDGELVILILKPSLWFILFNAMWFGAVVVIAMIAAQLWMPERAAHTVLEIGVILIAGRLMWAVLQWMGRLYVLTDLRVVRLSGVFNVDIIDCPLRKVAQARLVPSFRERLVRLGSIEVIPRDDTCPAADWRTIKRPNEVLRTLNATIERAKQGPGCQM